MTRRRLHHWKTYEDQLHWNLIVKDIYILFSRQNTICQWKRNFSAVYCPSSTIYTVEQSLGVIAGFHRHAIKKKNQKPFNEWSQEIDTL